MTRSARQAAYFLILALAMPAPAESGAAAAAPGTEQSVVNSTKSNVKEHSRALVEQGPGTGAANPRQPQNPATAAPAAEQSIVNTSKSNTKDRAAAAPAAEQSVINTSKSNIKEHSRAVTIEGAGTEATDARQRHILATAAGVQERISRSPGEKAALLRAASPEAARAVLLRNGFTADQLAGASIVRAAAASGGDAKGFVIIIRFKPRFEIIWRDN